MEKRYIYIAVFVLVAAVVLLMVYLSQGIIRSFKAEVSSSIVQNTVDSSQILTENDIRHLPAVVQKYMKYVGVIGKERVTSVYIKSEVDSKLGEDKDWSLMKTEEYVFFGNEPARVALMKLKVNGIPVTGKDSYIGGKGHMLIKPFGLLAIADAKGQIMDDTSAAVLVLLSMCTNAPSALTDSRIEWVNIDNLNVKAIFNDGKVKISADLTFNEAGELVNFSTEDKYYSPTGKTYEKVKWSAPIRNYKEINGLKLSTYGEAIWNFKDHDFCYGKSTLKEMQFNIKKLMSEK